MPKPPPGEADLRALGERFANVDARVRGLVGHAPTGDRRGLAGEALRVVAALRREDYRAPVLAAYLQALRGADTGAKARTVKDLAGSLAVKLERAVETVSEGLRPAFRLATEDNVADVVEDAVTAHIDARGNRWTLAGWAQMNTQTIGRQATSRGVANAVGKGGKVIIDVGECGYCASFAGEAMVGTDPLPPYHPSCTCTASAA